jgi:hypothetical protein
MNHRCGCEYGRDCDKVSLCALNEVNERGNLEYETDVDYKLKDGYEYVWITVGNISVYMKRTDEGVVVDLYPLHNECADPPLGSTYAFFSEAEPNE